MAKAPGCGQGPCLEGPITLSTHSPSMTHRGSHHLPWIVLMKGVAGSSGLQARSRSSLLELILETRDQKASRTRDSHNFMVHSSPKPGVLQSVQWYKLLGILRLSGVSKAPAS